MAPLAGCDLAKNSLKMDRSTDMEVQDYRDALAQRLPENKASAIDDGNIPEFKSYMATPSDKLKPMPLVSVSVNQSVPLKDVLYEMAEQAGYDIQLDPRITGSVIFSVRNRPFDEAIDRLAESSGLRYKFDGDSVKVELDTPYHKIYKINYLNYVRNNASSISNDVAVVSGEGADTGSKFKADSSSVADFWAELDANLTQIMGVNREAASLRTNKDPSTGVVSTTPAPVEPVILSADGSLTPQGQAGGVQPVVQAPEAVLRVEPLPASSTEDAAAAGGGEAEDPFQPRYSLNRQAGIISVFASDRTHKQVVEYLDELKKSVTAQVLIEAKVLEVGLSDEFSAGIDWSAPELFGNKTEFAINSIGTTLAPAFDPVASNTIGLTGTTKDLNRFVELMQRFGTVHALASPRLTVLNNQSAVLNVAKNQVYFELDITTTQDEGTINTTVESEIRNVPEGVLINVQPSIDLDNRSVSLAVRPTVTRIVNYVNDPGVAYVAAITPDAQSLTSPVPVVNVQEFDSVISVNSGQAIVMGGLIQDRSASTQVGVPVLSEVPMLGGLFRSQSDKIEKTELVVLMKATIVEGSNTIHQTDKDLYRSFSQDRRPFDL